MSSALDNNLLSNSAKVYPGPIDNYSFNASKYGSNELEISNTFKGGKRTRGRKGKRVIKKGRKTYKRGRVGKGRRTRRDV